MVLKKICSEPNIQCHPLDSLEDMTLFMDDPPPWHVLCEPITPHSKYLRKNSELIKHFHNITLERAQNYCHTDQGLHKMFQQYEEYMLPKTMIVHEFSNGYKDDSYVDGTSNFDTYTFHHWAGIDIFCYFSRHLITIPPVGWINIAHAHGVKVIGTFVTQTLANFWDTILTSDSATDKLLKTLVFIAKTYKFEGWLLRFKNKVTNPKKLLEFVRNLHKGLHAEIPDAVLIWADVIGTDGNIHRDHKLTKNTKPFFDICDGFFTRCAWNEAELEDSIQMAAENFVKLYVGFDIWDSENRVFGGGRFNTQQAVKYAHSYGCSFAIYAPAWTHQAVADPNNPDDINAIYKGEQLSKNTCIRLRDRAFWGSLWPFLNTKVPCTLPFRTSFCEGRGIKRRLNGEVLCNVSWFNLRHMQYQPNSSLGNHGYLLGTYQLIKKVFAEVKNIRGTVDIRQTFIEQCRHAPIDSDLLVYSEGRHQVDFDISMSSLRSSHDVLKDSMSFVTFTLPPKKRTFKERLKTIFAKKDKTISNKILSSQTPVNISAQQLSTLKEDRKRSRPSLAESTHVCLAYLAHERECLEIYYDDCFNGGSCLLIHPSDQISTRHRTIRLFHCGFDVEDTLLICFVTKTMPGFGTQYLNLIMHVTELDSDEAREVILVGRKTALTNAASTKTSVIIYPANLDGDTSEFKDLETYLILNQPEFYFPKNLFGWRRYYFILTMPGSCITTINLKTGLFIGSMLLGYLGLTPIPRQQASAVSVVIPKLKPSVSVTMERSRYDFYINHVVDDD